MFLSAKVIRVSLDSVCSMRGSGAAGTSSPDNGQQVTSLLGYAKGFVVECSLSVVLL